VLVGICIEGGYTLEINYRDLAIANLQKNTSFKISGFAFW